MSTWVDSMLDSKAAKGRKSVSTTTKNMSIKENFVRMFSKGVENTVTTAMAGLLKQVHIFMKETSKKGSQPVNNEIT